MLQWAGTEKACIPTHTRTHADWIVFVATYLFSNQVLCCVLFGVTDQSKDRKSKFSIGGKEASNIARPVEKRGQANYLRYKSLALSTTDRAEKWKTHIINILPSQLCKFGWHYFWYNFVSISLDCIYISRWPNFVMLGVVYFYHRIISGLKWFT